MTNMETTQELVETSDIDHLDHQQLDALFPAPRPWWVRLLIAVTLIGMVALSAAVWGLGFATPKPDCCGGGSGSRSVVLSRDGKSVVAFASFFNSSPARLRIGDAAADLAGAEVQKVELSLMPGDDDWVGADGRSEMRPLPASVSGSSSAYLAITFVPLTCVDDDAAWGHVTLQLETTTSWLPKTHRTYRIADPIVKSTAGMPAAARSSYQGPLARACELLGRSDPA